jgi:hypothetical protein
MEFYSESLELEYVPKGNKSLAEAFKELDLVKKAFERSSRIEQKILKNESDISDIKNRLEVLSSLSYVDSKTEKLQLSIDSIIKSKLEEYTSSFLFEINKKINETDAKKLFDTKVNWQAFNELKNTYASIKMKLDTHIGLEFQNNKQKVEEELRKFQAINSQNHLICLESLSDIKNRFEFMENKVREVLDDQKSISQSQSEEDFEKMMKNLEDSILPGNLDHSEKKKTLVIETSVKHKYLDSKSPLVGFIDTEPKTPFVGFNEFDKLKNSNEVDKIKNSIEFFGEKFSPSYRKTHQEPFSRKNSIASSTGPGSYKQMFKKVNIMEKDITDIYQELEFSKNMFKKIEDEIKSIHGLIQKLNQRCDQIQEFEKQMENTFVNRLRVKDMQNKLKKDNVLITKLPGEEIVKLNKEITEKNKKIVQMENYLKYIVNEVDYIKVNQSCKFKDFQETLTVIERNNKHHEKEFNTLKTNFSQIECNLSENFIRTSDDNKASRPATSYTEKKRETVLKTRRKSQDLSKLVVEDPKNLQTEVNPGHFYRGKSTTPKIYAQARP